MQRVADGVKIGGRMSGGDDIKTHSSTYLIERVETFLSMIRDGCEAPDYMTAKRHRTLTLDEPPIRC